MPPTATALMLLYVVAPLVVGLALGAVLRAWLRRDLASDDHDAAWRLARLERNRALLVVALSAPGLVMIARHPEPWRDAAEIPLLMVLLLAYILVGGLRAHRRMRALARAPR
jgi:hypothetical protein